MTPKRIQRKRTKGWRMPEGAVYVGRPTKWGNPFQVGENYGREDRRFWYLAELLPLGAVAGLSSLRPLETQAVVDAYLSWLIEQAGLMVRIVDELAGSDLVCWCPLDRPCHADVLLEIANAERT